MDVVLRRIQIVVGMPCPENRNGICECRIELYEKAKSAASAAGVGSPVEDRCLRSQSETEGTEAAASVAHINGYTRWRGRARLNLI
jgi:hypothetical protein